MGIRERVRHLPLALAVSGIALLLASVIGGMARGWIGAVGVAAGVLLVVASYVVSTLAIAWADTINTRMVLPVGMGMYVMKFSLFGAMLIFIEGADWAGKIPMAMGIIVGVVAWTGFQIWWTVHLPR